MTNCDHDVLVRAAGDNVDRTPRGFVAEGQGPDVEEAFYLDDVTDVRPPESRFFIMRRN